MTHAGRSSSAPHTHPLVSVVIPAFNAAETIAQTIQSILAQSYAPLEIVVVDDGSIDHTAQVLDSFGPVVRRITKPNGGLASARNAGCAAARGEYIALMDADDLCAPDRIALQVAAFRADPDIVLVCSDFDAFGRDGLSKPCYVATYYSAINGAAQGIATLFPDTASLNAEHRQEPVLLRTGALYPALALGNVVHPPTCMFRSGLFTAAGAFDETIRNMCDWEWLVRAARLGRFGFIEKSLLLYRLSDSQLSGVKHHAQAMRDIVNVFELIARRDPAIQSSTHGRFNFELSQARIWAADAVVDTDAWEAVRYLYKSARHGITDRLWLAALAKCMLPRPLIGLIKSLKHQST